MSLPVYNQLVFNQSNIDDLESSLKSEINTRHPVAINLLALDFDQQRETIGLIENFFVSHNLSFKYPYPVYLVTQHEPSITNMPVVRKPEELPRFYSQKESRMNVKEGHVASKNKLLQQEIRNTDAVAHTEELERYGSIHREIYENELERQYLKNVLGRLIKGAQNG